MLYTAKEIAMLYAKQEGVTTNEITALAFIVGSCNAIGFEKFTKVLIDYGTRCVPAEEYMTFLQNVSQDNGILED